MSNTITTTSLNNVIKDERFQARAEVCEEYIQQLTSSILEDGQKEPVAVWLFDTTPADPEAGTKELNRYWLVDGFHRWMALDTIRKEHGKGVNAKIEIVGTGADFQAAMKFAIQANAEHDSAKYRTIADKRKTCVKAIEWLRATEKNVWRIDYKEVAAVACVSEATAKKAVAGI